MLNSQLWSNHGIMTHSSGQNIDSNNGLYGICIIEIDSSCIKKPTELKGDSLYQLRSPMAEGGEP